MSECANLDEVRDNIDRVDREIVALLAERQGYVTQAARMKSSVAEVVDQARIEDIIAKVRAIAAEHGADADVVERIYRRMIACYIDFETAEHARIHGSED